MSSERDSSAPVREDTRWAAAGKGARAWQRLKTVWHGAIAQGALWTTGGYGVSQVLRLATNLVITRLLNPEAFGLMAIVDTLMIGLHMVSDTGVGPALVHRREAPDSELLDTAWSMQALRGLLLYVVLVCLAPPLASWYGEPALTAMLTIAGGQLILEGFQSTGLLVAARVMALRRLVLFELVVQLSGIAFVLAFAWLERSVWALVWGGLAAGGVRLLASHAMFPRRGARLRWARERARELVQFGRWLLPSTALLFVVLRSDRLLVGKWLSAADLGAYNIACFVPLTVIAVVGQVSHNVLFPIFARLGESGPSRLRVEIARKRLIFLALTLPALCCVAVFGDWLVVALYDSRYHEAGWMLRVLACGAIVACANENALPMLLALGDPYRRFVALLCSSLLFVGSIVLGGALAGRAGLVAGVAAAPAFAYPMISWALRKHGAWTAKLDFAAFSGAAAVILLLGALRRMLE